MNLTARPCLEELPFAYKPHLKNLYITVELIIAVLAIIGNFLVCLAIAQNKRLRTVANYFLASLSVADSLVGLVAIPCAVLTDLGYPHHDLPLCAFELCVLMVLTQSSILSLLAVAVERYIAILLPLQYHRMMSPRKAQLALLLTWGLAVISGCVPFMNWQKQPKNSVYCIFICVANMSYLVYCNLIGFILVPLIFMFIIYTHIFLIVRGQLRRIAQARTRTMSSGTDNTGSTDAAGRAEKEEKVDTLGIRQDSVFTISDSNPEMSNRAKTLGTHKERQKATFLFLLLFLFTVCWTPICIVNLVLFFCPTCNVPMPILLVAVLMSHVNSALNPLLYAYRMRSFRRALAGIWTAVWPCQGGQD